MALVLHINTFQLHPEAESAILNIRKVEECARNLDGQGVHVVIPLQGIHLLVVQHRLCARHCMNLVTVTMTYACRYLIEYSTVAEVCHLSGS